MSKLFDFPTVEDGLKKGLTLTKELKSSKYRISYTCNNIGDSAYFMIYETNAENRCNSYFMPIQFTGDVNFNLELERDAIHVEFNAVLNGAEIVNFTLETIDEPYLEYVKENTEYWDRIKDVTSETGKLRADTLEGLINTTLNAFANAAGTITTIDGTTTYLNGKTPEESTQALQVTGGAIRIASSKLANGDWNFSTALTGAGINADTIVTGTLRAIDISGVNITASNMTSGNITGVNIKGSTIDGGVFNSGDIQNGNYMALKDGYLGFLKNNQHSTMLNDGKIWLTSDKGTLSIDTAGDSGVYNGVVLKANSSDEKFILKIGSSELVLRQDGSAELNLGSSKEFCIEGNVNIRGKLDVYRDLDVTGGIVAQDDIKTRQNLRATKKVYASNIE